MQDRFDASNPFAPPPMPVGPVDRPGERPDDGRRPDLGTPTTRLIAWISLIVLFVTTVAIQQLQYVIPPEKPAAAATSVAPTDDDLRVLIARLVVKMHHATKTAGQPPEPGVASTLAPPGTPAIERLRSAVVAAELEQPDAAKSMLREAKKELEAGGSQTGVESAPPETIEKLIADTDTLFNLYDSGGSLDPATKKDLETRHGYFARLAGVWRAPDSTPDRERIVRGGLGILLATIGFGVLIGGGLIAGLAMFIVAIVKYASGSIRPRFALPVKGGSVYLETVAVFFLAFLVLKVAGGLLESSKTIPHDTKVIVSLAAQWLILPLIAWPVLRGVPFSQWRKQVGLHSGEGPLKEVFAGIGAYLAGIPILIVGALVSFGLVFARGLMSKGPPASPENPIIDAATAGGPALWMLVALATIWAPIVEETIFRGSLYRHLRSGIGVVLAAILTAFVFGGAHGYEWLMLGVVIALGFNFSLMREWRGSLIAPITAHALHNGTVMALLITFISFLKD